MAIIRKKCSKKITEINVLSENEIYDEMKRANDQKRNYFLFTHKLSDGSLRQVEVYSNPVLINGKNYLYSFVNDITEKEKLEEMIQKQERKYKLLFETTGAATFFIEKDYTISLVNHEAEILTGFTKEEIEGNIKFIDLIAYTEEKEKMVEYNNARRDSKTGVPNRYEFSMKDKYGNIKEVLINVRMIKDTEQTIVSLVDITDRKKQQKELLKAYNKLNSTMDKARMLHQRFLPSRLPDLEEVSMVTYFNSSDKIGGDFYNFIESYNNLIFYIVDITGHGLDGAMLNIFIREAINNFIIKNEESNESLEPNKIIEYVAKKYHQEEFPEDYFICMIIGIIDLETYQVKVSNSGIHVLPFITDIQSKVNELSISGLPITNTVEEKLYRAENIEQESFVLDPGTTLIVSSDGKEP